MTLASFWNGAKAPLRENKDHITGNKSTFFRRMMKPLAYVMITGALLAIPIKAASQYGADARYPKFVIKKDLRVDYAKRMRVQAYHYDSMPLCNHNPARFVIKLPENPTNALLRINLLQIDPNQNKEKPHWKIGFEMAPTPYGFGDRNSAAPAQWPYDKGVSRVVGLYVRPFSHKHAKLPEDAYVAPAIAKKRPPEIRNDAMAGSGD